MKKSNITTNITKNNTTNITTNITTNTTQNITTSITTSTSTTKGRCFEKLKKCIYNEDCCSENCKSINSTYKVCFEEIRNDLRGVPYECNNP